MRNKLLLSTAAVILATLSASVANAAFNPIPLQTSSYNADVIVESNATPVLTVVTTATVDNGTNNTANTWFEIGYDTGNPGNGLPAAGSVIVAQDNPNYSFKMPPTYAGPNGILIDTVITNGTFTLTTPAAYNLLSFIGSGGNGGDVIGVRVNHADSTFEVGSFGCPDWFGGSGVAYTAGGRLQNTATFTTEVNGGNPRIYFRDVALTNTTSPVTSIVLTYASGGAGSHNDILGVSGATTPGGPVTPIIVTGYTYDFVCEASAPKRGRVVSQTIVDGTNVWATTQTMDNDGNTGFCWYEKGHDINMINNGPIIYGNPTVDAIARASGLPTHGTTFTNGAYSFTMAPDYTANNVVWVSTVVTNATITFATPTLSSALSFLCAAGNGPVSPMVIIHHQDLTSETNIITIVDWFSGITPMYIPNGRVAADTAQWSQQVFAGTGANRLFNADIALANTASPVTSIDLVYTNTAGRAGIFAVSGVAGTAPPIITGQPASTNVYIGTPVGFSVVASGVSLTYQWQKGTNGVYVNLSNGGTVSGATTANLAISSVVASDEADYRAVVTNPGGSPVSSAATLRVFSNTPDVTAPGDTIANLPNMNPFGDGAVSHAVDNDLGQKWGSGVSGPSGCVISPAVGATLVNALRVYTANDAEERDPTDYKLEGSTDGGSTYSLIASNALSLPAGRNTTGGAPDPLTQFVQEVRFANAAGYSTYRLTFSHYKGGAGQGSMQVGEIELLGVATNILSAIVPSTAKAYVTTPLTLTATLVGSPTPTARWQKQISGVFTDLTDGGVISGSQTASLTINPAAYSDSGSYRAIASNVSGSSTSGVVQVTILSTNVDVTVATDPITDFGNTSTSIPFPGGAIDDTFSSFVTRGSGLNNNAGFPPFAGPVGLVITPAVGRTLISALRLYPGGDGTQQDPADVKLEGSNNGGTSYTTLIPTTALAIPDDRNPVSTPAVDPLTTAVQEIRFPNTQSFTSYRLTFNNTKDNANASQMSIGELELLGLPVPTVTIASGTGGSLDITSSVPGTLQSNTNLATGTWISEGPISGTINIVPNPAQRAKFYRVVVP
ncbi:MAG: hypothetical protein U1F83_09605 [Verrucomicrobiota bacterium]